MAIPMDAPIGELAKHVGATQQEIEALPQEVKQLTHRQLLEAWGVDNDQAALDAYERSQTSTLSPLQIVQRVGDAVLAPLHLQLSDVASIQSVFSAERMRAFTGSAGFAQAQDVSACCSCTPCCCCCCMAAMDTGKTVVAP